MSSKNKIDLKKTATEHIKSLKNGDYTSLQLTNACLDQEQLKKDLNAFLHIDSEIIKELAEKSDQRRKQGKLNSEIDGIPVSIKDNICIQNSPLGCASKILEGYKSPYDATVIEKLKASGAILFGRTNMDEFAMGSSTENSAYAKTLNPWNENHVPGGSSGGAAVSIAAGITPLALGSDTGGSIRQPASFCGITGMKPTYGRVSRYGLAAYASSLDQIGPLAKTPQDCALLLSAIHGHDAKDSSSRRVSNDQIFSSHIDQLSSTDWKKITIGVHVPKKGLQGYSSEIVSAQNQAIDHFKQLGAKTIELTSKYEDYIIPTYYILATAEASSNLSRYDGIRYGHRNKDQKDLLDLYIDSRTEGFGPEVKRRILLGTFVLSSGYYDAFYKTALKTRVLIQNEYADFFNKCDVILQPASIDTAFKINDKTNDPIAMYQSDLLTISANLAGLPAISIPAGISKKGLPLGLQLLAAPFNEKILFEIANEFLSIKTFTLDYSVPIETSGIKINKRLPKKKVKENKSINLITESKNSKQQRELRMKKKTSRKKAAKKKSAKKKVTKKKKVAKKKKKVTKKKKVAKKKKKVSKRR